MAAPEARRLAVGAILAVHDGDRAALAVVLRGVSRPVLAGVVEALAELANEALKAQTDSPAEARELLANFALRLAAA